MNIRDTFKESGGSSSSSNGRYERLGYDARERRLAEERETDELRAWNASFYSEPPADPPWHRCFRCHAKVDYRDTGDPMSPIAVYDHKTNIRHRLRCYDRRKR